MRRKLCSGLALLSILVIISATYMPVNATITYTAGVTAGTATDYTYSQTNVTTPNRIHIDVTYVNTSKIVYNIFYYNPDNSVNNSYLYRSYNVTTLGLYGPYLYFIGANLNVTNPVYPGALYVINETIPSYSTGGASRTVNHSNQTYSSLGIPYLVVNGWWDKPTGLLVKLSYHSIQPIAYWVNLTLTGTSLWTPGYGASAGGPNTTTLLLIGVGAVVVIAIVAIVVVRRRK
jgi:hypothetical protein